MPTTAFALNVFFRLTFVTWQTAHRLRWLWLMIFKLNFCTIHFVSYQCAIVHLFDRIRAINKETYSIICRAVVAIGFFLLSSVIVVDRMCTRSLVCFISFLFSTFTFHQIRGYLRNAEGFVQRI